MKINCLIILFTFLLTSCEYRFKSELEQSIWNQFGINLIIIKIVVKLNFQFFYLINGIQYGFFQTNMSGVISIKKWALIHIVL